MTIALDTITDPAMLALFRKLTGFATEPTPIYDQTLARYTHRTPTHRAETRDA